MEVKENVRANISLELTLDIVEMTAAEDASWCHLR